MAFQIFLFIVAAITAFMPTIFDMKVRGKKLNWWRSLTVYGKIYIVVFLSFFCSGLYLTIKSHNESVAKEVLSINRIKSDSILMSNLTVKVNKLFLSDSTQRVKNDSLSKVIRTLNKQIIQSGGSGLQNNAPNYGIQAARDVNIGTDVELSQADLQKGLNMVNQLVTQHKLDKKVLFMMNQLSNGQKAAKQLSDFLKSNGFDIMFGMSLAPMGSGMTITHDPQENIVVIAVGEFR